MESSSVATSGSTEPSGPAQVPAAGPIPPEHRRRIFISYGHDENAAVAERIRDDLKARGHEVWFDTERLKPGVEWDAHIEKALDWVGESQARGRVVLVITPHAVGRPDGYCLNEVALALDLKLRVIPVVVVWCRPPLSIYRIQRLDMQDCVPCQDNQEHYEKKIRLLAESLELDEGELPKFDDVEPDLLRHLQPLDYAADIKLHFPRFTGRRWVFDEIDKWLADPNAPRVFCITGWAGTGKSAIAAYFCAKRPEVVAFHICVYGHTQKADPRRCITSIAYQLSTQFPLYRERLSTVDWDSLKDANTATLFDELIVKQLAAIVPDPNQKQVIVIDALDEATQGDRNELVEFLSSDLKRAEGLRLLVTTRPVPQVVGALTDAYPLQLDTARPENLADIREYAERQLTNLNQPLTEDSEVLRKAVETIVARSEGLFLYAYWVCEELKRGGLSINQAENFPSGLASAYRGFFARQFPDTNKYDELQPKLAVIVAAYDALPQQMLNEIFGLNDFKAKKLFDPLRPLFPCVDGRFRPFHLSILEWLSDLGDSGAGPYCVDMEEAHRKLADYCWSKCQDAVKRDLSLRAQYQTYAFRHGVRHLIESKRFADAVELLDYLFRHSNELNPEEANDLDQLAKLVTIALGEKTPEPEEAQKIDAWKLAQLLKGLYMTQPLYGGVRLLVKYHPKEWPAILEEFLRTDDYVLRHTIAEALADDYLESGEPKRLEQLYALSENSDLNKQEVAAYAIQGIYAAQPRAIEAKYLNWLANGETYPFRSALGDLLLGLALQDVGTSNLERLQIMDQVDSSTIFWNPIWDFNRMDNAWLRAVSYFVRSQPAPTDAPQDVVEAHNSLVAMEKLRNDLLASASALPYQLRDALTGYYELGIKPELIPVDCAVLKGLKGIDRVFELLFAHPMWEVTETAASLLASLVDNDPFAAHYISDLFKHDLWRVQYGAAEAAFLARFKNNNQLFRQAVNTFYRHPQPLLKGDCAENLAAWILDSVPSTRSALLRDFQQPLSHWIANEQEDAWVLDHVYRLFHQLHSEGLPAEYTDLLNGKVSSLLTGDPAWYILDRQAFLLRIEQAKRKLMHSVV